MIDINIIKSNLDKDIHIEYVDVTNSTNEDVKKYINEKKAVVISSEQTNGRGRIGHSFASPKGGIYLSLIIDVNDVVKDNISLITPMAAVAIHRAIQKTLGINTQIKWINDIFYLNKKICGILAEAHLNGDKIDKIILGIGIDYCINADKIEEDLKPIVGSIYTEKTYLPKENELICELIKEIYSEVEALPNIDFMEEYRANCITINKDISFFWNNKPSLARAINVTNKGELEVAIQGKKLLLNAGEVSIIR